MKVCFAGERTGMTDVQRRVLEELLVDLGTTELHHCDNLGADQQAQRIAEKLGIPLIVWPYDGAFWKDKQLNNMVSRTSVVLFTPSSRTQRKGSTAWLAAEKAQQLAKRYAMIETIGSVVVWQGSVCLGMMTRPPT